MTRKNNSRVLVGFDGTELAEKALRRAFELADRYSTAEVHVVRIRSHGVDAFSAGTTTGVWLSEVRADNDHSNLEKRVMELYRDWAQDRLKTMEMESVMEGLPDAQQGVPESRRTTGIVKLEVHSRSDMPVHGILSMAEELNVDMIVMGTHGRRGLRHFLFGSVAEEIVRNAHCPVLVVHLDEKLDNVPQIEPPCPQCVAVRFATEGKQQWCARHREHHTFGHSYHYVSRTARGSQRPVL